MIRTVRPNTLIIAAGNCPWWFTDSEVAEWCRGAGLEPALPQQLPGEPLTVVIWTAHRAAAAASPFDMEMRQQAPDALLERELR